MMKSVLATIHIDGSYWHPHYLEWKPPITYVKGQLELGLQGSLHWQLYMECKPPQSIKSWKTILMCDHVHLEGRKGSQQDCINYVSKTDTRVHGPETDFEHGTPDIQKDGYEEAYRRALGAESYNAAIQILREKVPRDYVLFNRQIVSTLQTEFKSKWNNNSSNLLFTVPRINQDKLNNNAIVINGPSGIGKTQYALSHFLEPVLLSHIDDLKKITPTTDGIVFDDMNFNHWPPNSCIHLCDMELPRSINVKYGTKEIPQYLKRIFTTNRPFNELWSKDCSLLELQAITRRCHCITFNNKLF